MGKPWYKVLFGFRKTIILILTPLLWLPVPLLYTSKAGRCAYAIGIMATYWMTEALPIAATALLPTLLFPWLGVLGSKDVCVNYLKDTNFLFVGGLLIAVAVEHWNLHKRIALRVLMTVGCKPQWLMFGFMITTAFLSMWLNNTATAAMLMPIANAVLTELKTGRRKSISVMDEEGGGMLDDIQKFNQDRDAKEGDKGSLTAENADQVFEEDDAGEKPTKNDIEKPENDAKIKDGKKSVLPNFLNKNRKRRQSVHEKFETEHTSMGVGMRISIAVAANIGGTATLTGTGPNIVFRGIVDTLYPGKDTGMNFSSWFIFAFPNMLVCLILSWMWMAVFFLGIRQTFNFKKATPREQAANNIIKKEYAQLGPITFAEGSVLIFFCLLATMWFTRDPAFMPGWGKLPFLEPGFITDACVGMTIACLLFMFPARAPNFLCFRPVGFTGDASPAPSLLDWETVHQKMAWGVLMVLGGSFALADACQKSGLSEDVGLLFDGFGEMEPWILALALCIVTGILTNFTSNTATATIFLPVVAKLAEKMHIHPFYLMIPVTVTTSYAFLLPVATPPNAIVFAYGDTKIMDMFKSGAFINIFTILILQVSCNTYAFPIFNLSEYPDWAAQPPNATDIFTTAPSVFNYTV